MTLVVALIACSIWVYLLCARGGFWRAAERDDREGTEFPAALGWPFVVAVVPARDEAKVVERSVGSLLRQDYPGRFAVILVDDHSADGTSTVARAASVAAGAADRLTILAGAPIPAGWTGKLWAVEQGVRHAGTLPESPDYVLLTDADIEYAPEALRNLVKRASANGFVLTSLMAKLRCESFAERALVPAFIFFFQMLYPFAWVNRQDRRTAGASGGCMLVRRDALCAAGGIEGIRGELIDDCALARRLKAHGPIWLGLTERVRSVRPYRHIGEIRRMVARTAYVQLRESPLLLIATALGMVLTYLGPPALALFGDGTPRILGAACWALMAFAFQPTLRFYRLSAWCGFALPAIAATYLLFTLDSAWQHSRGRGGMWKGRAQAVRSG